MFVFESILIVLFFVCIACLLGVGTFLLSLVIVDSAHPWIAVPSALLIAVVGCIFTASLSCSGIYMWFDAHTHSYTHHHCQVLGLHQDFHSSSYILRTTCGEFTSQDDNYNGAMRDHSYTITEKWGEVQQLTGE